MSTIISKLDVFWKNNKNKIVLVVIILLFTFAGIGIGYMIGYDSSPAPIVIEKNS